MLQFGDREVDKYLAKTCISPRWPRDWSYARCTCALCALFLFFCFHWWYWITVAVTTITVAVTTITVAVTTKTKPTRKYYPSFLFFLSAFVLGHLLGDDQTLPGRDHNSLCVCVRHALDEVLRVELSCQWGSTSLQWQNDKAITDWATTKQCSCYIMQCNLAPWTVIRHLHSNHCICIIFTHTIRSPMCLIGDIRHVSDYWYTEIIMISCNRFYVAENSTPKLSRSLSRSSVIAFVSPIVLPFKHFRINTITINFILFRRSVAIAIERAS